jgi:acetyl esterase/lipase
MITLLLQTLSVLREKVEYCQVDGQSLTLNAFVPANTGKPSPAMVDIHGGWFIGGEPAGDIPGLFKEKGVAFFSVGYRLGDEGGFPKCIRDCRNAVRFLRKNAARFNIDPSKIAVMGGSAGGHLSLMVAMVPETFDDGGPTPELEGVSAKVCGAFSWIPPTDFVKFWNQGPDDVVVAADGTQSFRHWDDSIPNDARPHLRALFHGASPESRAGAALFRRMSPIGHVRSGLPPVLVCDGEHDPIVPGTMGRDFVAELKKVRVDATFWLSRNGHEYPAGPGFDETLHRFLEKIWK